MRGKKQQDQKSNQVHGPMRSRMATLDSRRIPGRLDLPRLGRGETGFPWIIGPLGGICGIWR